MLEKIAQHKWDILALVAIWLFFESSASWEAFCHQPKEYGAAYQSPEKYECVFRGPVMLILRSFVAWWNHVFDKPDAWVALFTGLLFVSTVALWLSTRGLLRATRNEFLASHRPRMRLKRVWFTDQ